MHGESATVRLAERGLSKTTIDNDSKMEPELVDITKESDQQDILCEVIGQATQAMR
jgi:hypothetical protein